jgi:hypothetical protein
MLAATGSGVVPITIVLIAISLSIAVSIAARRGVRRLLQGSLVVRDGRPALSDEARAKLDKRGLDTAQVEDVIAKKFTLNERGEIVTRTESAPTKPPVPTASVTRAPEPDPSVSGKPQPATDREGFHSVWEEQDAGPSIWDEADKAAFWGDAEKRE